MTPTSSFPNSADVMSSMDDLSLSLGARVATESCFWQKTRQYLLEGKNILHMGLCSGTPTPTSAKLVGSVEWLAYHLTLPKSSSLRSLHQMQSQCNLFNIIGSHKATKCPTSSLRYVPSAILSRDMTIGSPEMCLFQQQSREGKCHGVILWDAPHNWGKEVTHVTKILFISYHYPLLLLFLFSC